MNEFYNFFSIFGKKTDLKTEKNSKNFIQGIISVKNKIFPEKSICNKKGNLKLKKNNKLKIHSALNTGKNVWLLKPIHLNRGRGIKVFNNLKTFSLHMNEFLSKMIENEKKSFVDISDKKIVEQFSKKIKDNKSKFIIQKYIEKPLLIEQRKFDIRVWVLITNDMKVYFSK